MRCGNYEEQVGQIQQIRRHDPSIQEEDARPDADAADLSNISIPIIREEVDVRKELVDKATVRITKIVEERSEIIEELLASEHIEIERFPLDQIVATPPRVRLEGDVMIIPVVEEILVVTKQFCLKEELRVTTKRLHTRHHQEVALRSEDVIVERFSNGKTD
jgi:uncharacterized protein (TIGR02271 family)